MGAEPGELAGLHILVVEDDDKARGILRDLLKYFGAYVTVARSAREALSKLRACSPTYGCAITTRPGCSVRRARV